MTGSIPDKQIATFWHRVAFFTLSVAFGVAGFPALAATPASQDTASPPVANMPPLAFTQIDDGIYVFEGEMVDMFTSPRGMVANVTFIVGSRSVAVIDTGSSYRQGLMIRQAISKVTPLPVSHVITTHVHPDHHFGNVAFVPDKPEFVAHHRYPGDFEARATYYRERLEGDWYKGTVPVPATRIIEVETALDLGDRELILVPNNRAHTRHDLTVFDQHSQTLITGDLVFDRHIPTLDGSLIGWLALLDTLSTQSFRYLVPGHGPVQTGTAAINKQRDYLNALAQAVRGAINNNVDIQTASETLLTDERNNWELFDVFHRRNVIQAYKELEWE